MKKLYELVVMIHPQLSKDEQTAIYDKINTLIGDGKKQVDDMGLVDLAHPIGKQQLTQAHILSHYCEIPAEAIPSIKRELSITKGIVRHVLFAMTPNDSFVTAADVNKKFIEWEDAQKLAAAQTQQATAETTTSGTEATTENTVTEGTAEETTKKVSMQKSTKKKVDLIVKKGYFNKKEHDQEISWKATKLLAFYMTRFGDVKPRRYMGNSVRQQKKVRLAILRARELGMLPYTN